MRRAITGLLPLFFVVPALIATEPANWKPLLKHGDLSSWEVLLGRPHAGDTIPGFARNQDGSYVEPIGLGRDPTAVFWLQQEAEGPVLKVTGRVFGALITKESYSNYHLRLQCKWGQQKWAPRLADNRDTGLLYHIAEAAPDGRRSVPRSLEFRIREGNTGDLYAIGMQADVRARLRDNEAPIYDPLAEPVTFGSATKPARPLCATSGDFERPTGEWNDLDLFCVGPDSVYVVNGHVVMRVRNSRRQVDDHWEPARHGRIAVQSEGAEVFFRKIEICAMAEFPDLADVSR